MEVVGSGDEMKFNFLVPTPPDLIDDLEELFTWLVVRPRLTFEYTNFTLDVGSNDSRLLRSEPANGSWDCEAEVMTKTVFSIWTLKRASLQEDFAPFTTYTLLSTKVAPLNRLIVRVRGGWTSQTQFIFNCEQCLNYFPHGFDGLFWNWA